MASRKIDDKSVKSYNWAGSYSYSFEAHEKDGQLRTDDIDGTNIQYREEPLNLNRNQVPDADWEQCKRAWEDSLINRWTGAVQDPNSSLKAVTLVFHDSDIIEEEDGTKHFKGLHAQICVHGDQMRKSGVMNILSPNNPDALENLSHIINTAGSYRYLLHATDEAVNAGKHVYSENELIVIGADSTYDRGWAKKQMMSNPKAEKKKAARTKEGKENVYMKGVMSGVLTVDEVKKAYMADEDLGLSRFASKRKAYEDWSKDYQMLLCRYFAKSESHFCRLFVLFTGDGGNMKSTVAEALAARLSEELNDKRGWFKGVAPSSTTFDPFQNYAGEKVAVFNEMRGQFWGAKNKDDFLNAFDPTRINPQGSRFHNVYFSAEYVFATSTEDVSEFSDNMLEENFNRTVGKGNAYSSDMNGWFNSQGKNGAYLNSPPFWTDDKAMNKQSYPYSDDPKRYAGTALDDLWQIRRRIGIVVKCKMVSDTEIELTFYYRLDNPKVGIHARYTYYANDLYFEAGRIVYDTKDAGYIDKVLTEFQLVEHAYYMKNGYSNNRDTIVEPSASDLLECL